MSNSNHRLITVHSAISKFLFLFMLIFLSNDIFGNVFVKTQSGYELKNLKLAKSSFNNIADALGFNKEEYYTYTNFDALEGDIYAALIKSFTSDIICIVTKDTKSTLSENEVRDYMIGYSMEVEFDSYSAEGCLQDGIKNGSLSTAFFKETLKIDIGNNDSFLLRPFNYELHFQNGILVRYNSSDGLGKWAKYTQDSNPELFKRIEAKAKKFQNGNMELVLYEINEQCNAKSNISLDGLQEYRGFHSDDEGLINFKLLRCAHFNEKITLTEFKKLNKGRYELQSEYNDVQGYKRATYQVNRCLFTFDENGNLVDTYTF